MKETIGRPISRRTFAKAMGAIGVSTALSVEGARMFVGANEAAAADGTFYGACQICDSVCGYKAVVSGDGYELYGNANDSQSSSWGDGKGRLCVKGYAGPDKALNADRVFYPMMRTNPVKGPNEDPGFVKITWAKAFSLAATKMNETIRELGPKGVVLGYRGNDWTNRFRAALGTPNQMSHIDTCFRSHSFAWGNMVLNNGGGGRPWTQDFGNSTYILSFGYDQVGKAQNPTVQGTAKALENGAKMTVFDPRMSTTAVKALHYGGRHYMIKPGTDLAVMWAIIKWIIDNAKWDANFVTNYVDATTFANLQTFVTSGAGAAYTPAWAEGLSGVPAADIVAVAQEFTNDGVYTNWNAIVPTHKRDGAGGPNYTNSWRSAMAEVILNALVGSIDKNGGVIPDRYYTIKGLDALFAASKPAVANDTAVRMDRANEFKLTTGGQGSYSSLFRQIVSESPYKVGFMFMTKYNLPFIAPQTDAVVAAMQKVFVVNHCMYADEGAWMSDLLLPDSTSYEKGNFITGGSGNFRPYKAIALNEKIWTLGDCKGIDGVFYGLSMAADNVANAGGYAAACSGYHNDATKVKPTDYPTATFLNGRDSLSKYFTTDFLMGGTQLSGGVLGNAQLNDLAVTAGSGWDPTYTSIAAFAAAEKASGATGPGNGVYPASGTHANYTWPGFSTKVKLQLTTLNDATKNPWGVTDASGFPTWSGKREATSAAYPFNMVTDREPMHAHTESKAEEINNELSGVGKFHMNTQAAADLGIVDGDTVIITSRVGTQESVVRTSDHIRYDTTHMMHGWGRWGVSASGNWDRNGVQTSRGFGLHAPDMFNVPSANDDALIPSQSYAEIVTSKDPSMSAAMQDVVVSVVKK